MLALSNSSVIDEEIEEEREDECRNSEFKPKNDQNFPRINLDDIDFKRIIKLYETLNLIQRKEFISLFIKT